MRHSFKASRYSCKDEVMPYLKCHHGCSMRVGTGKWISTLTIDQMRYAREAMDKKIKAAEESPKRPVWRLCRGGLCEENCREEDRDLHILQLA